MADFRGGNLWRYEPSARTGSSGSPPTASRATSPRWAARSTSAPTAASCRASSRATTRRPACARTGIDLLACAMAVGRRGASGPRAARSCSASAPGDGRLRKLRRGFLPVPVAGDRRDRARASSASSRSAPGSLWVLGDALDRRLWRLDARTGRVRADDRARLPADVRRRSRPAAVWITDGLDDRVVPLDVATGRLLAPVPVGRGASRHRRRRGRGLGGEHARRHAVAARPVATRRVVATIDVGGAPARRRGRRRGGLGDRACVDGAACSALLAAAAAARGLPGRRRGARRCGSAWWSTAPGIYRSLEDAELSGAALPLIERGARLRGRGARPTGSRPPRWPAGRVELVRGCTEAFEFSTLTSRAAAARRARARRRRSSPRATGPTRSVMRDVAAALPAGRRSSPVAHGPREVTLHRAAPNLFRFAADHGQGVAGLGDARLSRASAGGGWRSWPRTGIPAGAAAMPSRPSSARSAAGVAAHVGVDFFDPQGQRRRARTARRRRRRRVRVGLLRPGRVHARGSPGAAGDPARQIRGRARA